MNNPDEVETIVKLFTQEQNHSEFELFMKEVATFFVGHYEFAKANPLSIVHSVKYRIKDSDHLRKKIQRINDDNTKTRISLDNAFERITDYAGVRVMHLHLLQLVPIDRVIMDRMKEGKWYVKEKMGYYWDPETAKFLEILGFHNIHEIKRKDDSYYTSVHYTIKPSEKSNISCEVQVRTLFEEIFGEVSHTFDYPNRTNSFMIQELLKVLSGQVAVDTRLINSLFKAHVDILVNYDYEKHKEEYKSNDGYLRQQLEYADFIAKSCKDYHQSLNWFKNILAFRENVLEKEAPKIAATYNDIAWCYFHLGDYPQALEEFNKALKIREEMLGKEHLDTAATYNDIAWVYDTYYGDYSQALEMLNKALEIRETILGKEHLDTASTYNNIAWDHERMGNYPQALEEYGKALTIRKNIYGENNVHTAATYNGIAWVYFHQGKYSKALKMFKKVRKIREKELEKDDPGIAAIYNDIAFVYERQGKYSDALEEFQKALEIRERKLGKDHPDTVETNNSIAWIDFHQGNYPQALEKFQNVLTIRKNKLAENHPDIAATYEGIAKTHAKLGDYSEALDGFGNAIRIVHKASRQNQPHFNLLQSNAKETLERTELEKSFDEWFAEVTAVK